MKTVITFFPILALTVIGIAAGCVSGPKSPERNFSQKMNGESYESSNSVMGVPVLTRKLIQRKLSGTVTCGEGLSRRPANHAAISLLDDEIIIAAGSSDVAGNFSFLAEVSVEKSYKIKASAKCGHLMQNILLKEDSRYDLVLKN